jgi:Protein involved in formate dehydrogenase formation
MQQNKVPAIDPVADDVASLGLDLLMRQTPFFRGASNPILLVRHRPAADPPLYETVGSASCAVLWRSCRRGSRLFLGADDPVC